MTVGKLTFPLYGLCRQQNKTKPLLPVTEKQVGKMPNCRLYHTAISSPNFNEDVKREKTEYAVQSTQSIVAPEHNDAVFESSSVASSNDSFEKEEIYFKNNTYRLPYSLEEDEWIVSYVLANENIFRVGSLSLWQQMEGKKMKPRRTSQSLKNRFLKNIKPHLFTTFRHLIQNEATEKKILRKFPELKKSLHLKKKPLEKVRLLKRAEPEKSFEDASVNLDTEKNRESTTSSNGPGKRSQQKITANLSLNNTTLSPLFVSSEGIEHKRSVQFNGNSFKVSVTFVKSSEKTSKRRGIYDTFESLSKNNVLIICPYCERGRPVSIGSESDSESKQSLITACSFGSFEELNSPNLFESNLKKTEEQSWVAAASPKPLPSSSLFSFLNVIPGTGSNKGAPQNTEFTQCIQNTIKSPQTKNTQKKRNQNKMSQSKKTEMLQSPKKLSLKNLALLYRKNILNCSKFMNSYDIEEKEVCKVNSDLRVASKEINLQKKISEKMSTESFFLESNSECSDSEFQTSSDGTGT